MKHSSFLLALSAALLAGAAARARAQHHNEHDARVLATDPLRMESSIAPVLSGLGDHHHPVTTRSERAQMFFDQGLKLTYGFNHQEALRSFKEAVRLDPDCAMAYWGWALVLGPNLNLPMQPEVVSQAYHAIQKAVSLEAGVTVEERAYIEALARRYASAPAEDRPSPDHGYADGMKELYERYPEDDDAATLYAASLMNLSPWSYWEKDGRPRENTMRIRSVLETVVARDPGHAGALHYLIHLTEAVDPWRAERAADLLNGAAPGAGHLTHMPSHIYMRTGRYADAFDANARAIDADEGYLTACRNQGIYPLGYYPHNIHFLAWAAIMQGRSVEALEASRKVAERVPRDMLSNDWALYQSFLGMPLYTMVRFGMWQRILNEPKPYREASYTTGIWHYARGMAYVRTGRLEQAENELRSIESMVNDATALETLVGFSNAKTLLQIASGLVAGELAAKRGSFDEAVSRLDRVVRLEDRLQYNEPPDWYYPVRHTLGAVLLEAGRADEAEVVYWQDLSRNPENGYALFGLAESLRAQGRVDEARSIDARFRSAWKEADVELRTSRF